MFSHAFEQAMKFFLLQNPRQRKERPGLEDAVNHEKVTLRIIRESSITDTLTNICGEKHAGNVAELIGKADQTCVYTSIVSGQLDADRLDYAKRNPYFAGVSSGGFDLDWLIRNLMLKSNSGGDYLFVNSKAYISIEQFTVTLLQLYPTIYVHRKTRGLEYMFSLLLSRIFELIADDNVAATGLTSGHPIVKFFNNLNDLEGGLRLDDTVFWGSLYALQEGSDEVVCRLAERIARRSIFPSVDVWRIADELAYSVPSFQGIAALARVKKIDAACSAACKELAVSSREKKGKWHYDTYGRPLYQESNSQQASAQ